MAKLVILEGEQLLKLARIIHYQEVETIKNIIFKSEDELSKYLRESKANYDAVLKLLKDGDQVNQKFQNDQTRSTIAHDIFSYLVSSANFAIQTIKNCTLRMNYLTKISQHAKDIIQALEVTDPKNVTNVARLAKEAVQYRNCMLEYTRKYQSIASRNFSRWLKESGIKFKELIARYQTKRNFTGSFKNLETEEKLLVYNDIIKASGRGNVMVNRLTKISGVAGIAALILIAGMMVWDIFSSQHIIQTATHDAVVSVASIGGAVIGEILVAAVPTLVGIEVSALFLMMAGIIGGIAGAFLIGTIAGWLVDLIFGSGGSTPFSTDGHHCYVAPLPDGEALARQIAHQHQHQKLTNYYHKLNFEANAQIYAEEAITRNDRAHVALKLKNFQDKDKKAREYVENLNEKYGTEVSTLCLIYNATGDCITLVNNHDWYGYLGPAPFPVRIENGQWGAFVHTRQGSGSHAAVVYSGKNGAGENCDWMAAWSNPMDRDNWDNMAYTEIRERGHFNKNTHWHSMSEILYKSTLYKSKAWNGCVSTVSTGSGSSAIFEAIFTLDYAVTA